METNQFSFIYIIRCKIWGCLKLSVIVHLRRSLKILFKCSSLLECQTLKILIQIVFHISVAVNIVMPI